MMSLCVTVWLHRKNNGIMLRGRGECCGIGGYREGRVTECLLCCQDQPYRLEYQTLEIRDKVWKKADSCLVEKDQARDHLDKLVPRNSWDLMAYSTC